MSSNIPLARQILSEALNAPAHEDFRGVIAKALAYMTRTYTVEPTRVKHKKVTKQMAESIRFYSKAHPDLSQEEVGRVFDVNAGRVSECMAGKR